MSVANTILRAVHNHQEIFGDVPKDVGKLAASAILDNLSDRRGIKHALADIDEDVMAELHTCMGDIINQCLELDRAGELYASEDFEYRIKAALQQPR